MADGERTSPVARGVRAQRADRRGARGLPRARDSGGPRQHAVQPDGDPNRRQDRARRHGRRRRQAEEPGATAGFLMRNLAAIGIGPNDVDVVVISHFHGDHVGGLVAPDGSPAFPRAEITVPANEWSFWTDDDERARATPGRMQSLFQNNRQIFDPLKERVQTHAWDDGGRAGRDRDRDAGPFDRSHLLPRRIAGRAGLPDPGRLEPPGAVARASRLASRLRPGPGCGRGDAPAHARVARPRAAAGAGLPLPVPRPRDGRGRRRRLPGGVRSSELTPRRGARAARRRVPARPARRRCSRPRASLRPTSLPRDGAPPSPRLRRG